MNTLEELLTLVYDEMPRTCNEIGFAARTGRIASAGGDLSELADQCDQVRRLAGRLGDEIGAGR